MCKDMQTISNSTSDAPLVNMRLPRGQKEAMEAAAETLGMNQSELMRHGIAHMVELAKKENEVAQS